MLKILDNILVAAEYQLFTIYQYSKTRLLQTSRDNKNHYKSSIM